MPTAEATSDAATTAHPVHTPRARVTRPWTITSDARPSASPVAPNDPRSASRTRGARSQGARSRSAGTAHSGGTTADGTDRDELAARPPAAGAGEQRERKQQRHPRQRQVPDEHRVGDRTQMNQARDQQRDAPRRGSGEECERDGAGGSAQPHSSRPLSTHRGLQPRKHYETSACRRRPRHRDGTAA